MSSEKRKNLIITIKNSKNKKSITYTVSFMKVLNIVVLLFFIIAASSFALYKQYQMGIILKKFAKDYLTFSNDVSSQLESIDNIRRSLKELDIYLNIQKNRVNEYKNNLNQMKHKNSSIAKSLSINQSKLNEFMRYYREEQENSRIRNLIISFGLGLLSGIIANTITGYIKSKNKGGK